MRPAARRLAFLALVALAGGAQTATAQDLALDHPRSCGPLVCYPSSGDPHTYFYLPAEPRVAQRADGSPELSLLVYQDLSSTERREGVTFSQGGGILHFLVELATTEEELSAARAALVEDDEDAVLQGPVQFREGTFALVSTFAADADDDRERDPRSPRLARTVLGTGRAPLLPGHRAAVSMHLTREGATLLQSSLSMAASDVSVVFELTFAGLRDPVRARLEADWDKVREQTETEIGVGFGYGPIQLGFDYDDFWDGMRESGAIRLDYEGEPAGLKALIERAYARLQEMVFEPVPLEQYEEQMPDVTDLAGSLMGAGGGSSESQAPWYLRLEGGYQLRKAERQGRFVLDFRERTADRMTVVLAGNLGDLFDRWGDDPRVFRVASTESPAFKVREVFFTLDGLHGEEYARFVNSVSVTLRKRHGSGRETVREALFVRDDLSSGEAKTLSYGWDREEGEVGFAAYAYSVSWSFLGGARYREEEQESTDIAHSLFPPFEFREVDFRASRERLAAANVRLVTATVWYDFFGRTRRERVELVPETDTLSVRLAIPVPLEGGRYDVQIQWLHEDGSSVTGDRQTTSASTIFCDNPPEG